MDIPLSENAQKMFDAGMRAAQTAGDAERDYEIRYAIISEMTSIKTESPQEYSPLINPLIEIARRHILEHAKS